MKKHKLRLDDLRVESFETAADTTDRGTVRGHDSIRPTVPTPQLSCEACMTPWPQCETQQLGCADTVDDLTCQLGTC